MVAVKVVSAVVAVTVVSVVVTGTVQWLQWLPVQYSGCGDGDGGGYCSDIGGGYCGDIGGDCSGGDGGASGGVRSGVHDGTGGWAQYRHCTTTWPYPLPGYTIPPNTRVPLPRVHHPWYQLPVLTCLLCQNSTKQ